jgi:hypothetical protein
MTKSVINLGTTPNDRTGDTLRDTGTKVNSNFSELYTALGNGTTLNIATSGATLNQILKFNGTNFVPGTDLNTDAVTSVNTKTGAVVLYTENITEPTSNTVLAGVVITGTAGTFTCTATTLAVGQTVTITGTLGGTGSITGYTTGRVYTISATNGTSSFTLQYNGAAIVTTAGTPTGLTYTPSTLNLYFNNTRARAAVSNGTGIGYSSTTGVISLSATSDDLTEGTTNLFYTASRFNNSLGSKSTNDLSEGTVNKYFSNTLARSAISVSGDISYDSATGIISYTSPVPSQTNNSGKYLTTDGTTASWATNASGTVTSISVVSANGFTGTVATSTSTPAITLTTSITGLLKGNGTAISAATSGTDYSPGTSALTTGIVKSTTTTGALSIAVAGTDYIAPSTNVTLTGLTINTGGLTVQGNISAPAWTTTGIRHISVSATLNDTTSTGTVPVAYTNNYGGNTISATNTGVTFTNYGTVFVNTPSAGTNVTITNPYSIITAGNILVGSTGTSTVTAAAATATTASTAASLGYMGTPINTQSANYTTVIGDAGKTIYVTVAGTTITIPANTTVAYPIGTRIEVITGPAGSSTTIALTTDTFVGKGGGSGPASLSGYGHAILTKVAATTWFYSVL